MSKKQLKEQEMRIEQEKQQQLQQQQQQQQQLQQQQRQQQQQQQFTTAQQQGMNPHEYYVIQQQQQRVPPMGMHMVANTNQVVTPTSGVPPCVGANQLGVVPQAQVDFYKWSYYIK